MGSVYKAEQPEMNRFVAIKILHPKYVSRPDLVSRFRREARAMSHLSHPNTARVYMYGQLEDGACYIVMEYLEGKNLAQVTRAEGMLQPARAINIMMQVCGALEEAHRQGIIHRDLKPENIFLTSQGGIADFPKVLDFGLAKVTQREMRPGSMILTQEGMVFGTPEFMSPEQARGEQLDARSDIYSLGCILYEMLTGKLPFDAAQPMDYLALQIRGTPIPLGERIPGPELSGRARRRGDEDDREGARHGATRPRPTSRMALKDVLARRGARRRDALRAPSRRRSRAAASRARSSRARPRRAAATPRARRGQRLHARTVRPAPRRRARATLARSLRTVADDVGRHRGRRDARARRR